MFFKKNLFNYLLVFSASLLFFNSCKKDDDGPNFPDTYTNGVFVLNQGNFNRANASVSFYKPADKSTESSIFEKVNGRAAGDVLQSMTVYDDKAYLVVNNSNRIEIVDEKSFQTLGTITGLALPRHMLVLNADKAYVSQWGDGILPGGVAVINLRTNSIEKIIETGEGAEKMLLENGKLYVCNSGGLSADETVAVVNTNTDEVEKRIKVSDGPSQIESAHGSIWVLCAGLFDATTGGFTDGALARINADTLTAKITIPNFPQNLVQKSGASVTDLYFAVFDGLYKASVVPGVAGVPLPVKVNSASYYGLGVEPATGRLFAADAKDFQSNGEVYILNENGSAVDSFDVGIAPGYFWFQ